MKIINFTIENWESILLVGSFIYGIIQTAWGMRHRDALDILAGVIESVEEKLNAKVIEPGKFPAPDEVARIIKDSVTANSEGVVGETIHKAVRRVDPKP